MSDEREDKRQELLRFAEAVRDDARAVAQRRLDELRELRALYDLMVELRKRDAVVIGMLEAGVARMRQVFDAAVAWARDENLDDHPALRAAQFTPSERDLIIAVMRALMSGELAVTPEPR